MDDFGQYFNTTQGETKESDIPSEENVIERLMREADNFTGETTMEDAQKIFQDRYGSFEKFIDKELEIKGQPYAQAISDAIYAAMEQQNQRIHPSLISFVGIDVARRYIGHLIDSLEETEGEISMDEANRKTLQMIENQDSMGSETIYDTIIDVIATLQLVSVKTARLTAMLEVENIRQQKN